MLLAELEVWHSRPYAPTRRVALGNLVLPMEPAPGFGGLLLGAIVAANVRAVDDELEPDAHRLIGQIERGERVVQPRLRHRFQADRHGLARSTHRLVGAGETLELEFDVNGTPLQQILGALYAVERLAPALRRVVVPVLRAGLRWRGPIGPPLITHLAGQRVSLTSVVDPVAWAMDQLGLPPGTTTLSRREVMACFRERVRGLHPDHGGSEVTASKAITDLTEARRILLAR